LLSDDVDDALPRRCSREPDWPLPADVLPPAESASMPGIPPNPAICAKTGVKNIIATWSERNIHQKRCLATITQRISLMAAVSVN